MQCIIWRDFFFQVSESYRFPCGREMRGNFSQANILCYFYLWWTANILHNVFAWEALTWEVGGPIEFEICDLTDLEKCQIKCIMNMINWWCKFLNDFQNCIMSPVWCKMFSHSVVAYQKLHACCFPNVVCKLLLLFMSQYSSCPFFFFSLIKLFSLFTGDASSSENPMLLFPKRTFQPSLIRLKRNHGFFAR